LTVDRGRKLRKESAPCIAFPAEECAGKRGGA
jgi:hypothetical protein